MSDWIPGGSLDVIVLKTKVKIRPSDQDLRYIDIELTYEQWRQFIDAVKAGVYDLP